MLSPTQVSEARKNRLTPEIKKVAEEENLPPETLIKRVAEGTTVIPANVMRRGKIHPRGIGQGLKVKVNANVGTSEAFPETDKEKNKLDAAAKAGADAVMDLSTGGDPAKTRSLILESCTLPVGTVPVYEATSRARSIHGASVEMTTEELFSVIEEHAASGVDFLTVHCGLTMEALKRLRKRERLLGIVSRGGAITAGWMLHREQENPLYEQFDRLLEIARQYDVTLSLGDGLRPGCIEDSTDQAQIQELVILGELVHKAREAEVQVMVEGPGHVPVNEIETNIKLAKSLCQGAPFYVLGPLVTDAAPGYDHITAAIGGTLAASHGADFLCYVTPAEHLGLPGPEHVREGVTVMRLAAHAADLARGIPSARERAREISLARRDFNWDKQIDLSLDPACAAQLYYSLNPANLKPEGNTGCTMCGSFCAVKLVKEYLKQ